MAENESMFNLTDLMRKKIGGTNIKTEECASLTTEPGVFVFASFITIQKRRDRTRIFLAHGTSDKPILKVTPEASIKMFDYFFMSGSKDAWLYGKYGHQLYIPINKVIKTGLIRSDLILNKVYNRDEILKKYGLPGDKKIVLYAPTFNAESLPVHGDKFTKEIPKKYTLVIKTHDREMSRVTKRIEGVYNFRGPEAEIMELISVADYYMGDGSSCDYEFLFTLKPMIMVLPGKKITGDVPFEYDIRNVCPYYTPDMDILKTLEEAENEKYVKMKRDFIDRCFYYNDGNAVDRACRAIKEFERRIEWWQSLD